MNLYLYSTARVAPERGPDGQRRQLATEPDYTGLIAAMQLRRMSKAVRMGIAASRLALQRAGLDKPAGISVGTALGCLQDTEHFLAKMVAQDEQLLTPTSFIQSTHNTVSGQIALVLGCHGHNLTFVQRGHSFAHAALNAALQLGDDEGETFLIGGLDEMTPGAHRVLAALGVNGDTNHSGPAVGEGAAFFVCGKEARSGAWRVSRLETFHQKTPEKASETLSLLLPQSGSPDLILSGDSGDAFSNKAYSFLKTSDARIQQYKSRTGELAVADALAVSMLMDGQFGTASRVLLVHHYLRDFTLWELERVPGPEGRQSDAASAPVDLV